MIHLAVAINDKDESVVSTLISIYTLSPAYHTELIFTDDKVFTMDPNGARFITRTYDRYHWVLIPLPWISPLQEKEIRTWVEELVASNPKYDWIGATIGRIKPEVGRNNKWFCSEACAAALAKYTPVITMDRWWSPVKLWKTCSDYLTQYDSKYAEGWRFRYKK